MRIFGVVLCLASIVLTFGLLQDVGASQEETKTLLKLEPTEPNEKEILLGKWRQLEKELKGGIETLVRQAMPTLLRFSSEAEITPQCQGGLLTLVQGLLGMKTWAFEMLDASGKPAAGMLMGTLTSFGSYEECLNIKVLKSNQKDVRFRGKYCTLELKPPLPPKPKFYTIHHTIKDFDNFTNEDSIITRAQTLVGRMFALSFRFGVCIPSLCDQEDLSSLAQLVGERIHFETKVKNCDIQHDVEWSTTQVLIASVFSVFAILNIVSTLFHVIYHTYFDDKLSLKKLDKPLPIKLAYSFSLLKSFPALFGSSTTLEPTFLHAMRALSLGWVILGSVFLFLNTVMLSQMLTAIGYADTFWLQFILNGTLGIDTMIFTTAYLLGYKARMRKDEPGNAIYFIKVLVVRYFKLLPILLCVIGMSICLPLTTSGPMWQEVAVPFEENCMRNWWSNVLFVNNFLSDPSSRCLYNSWFLSCEMQLFIIGLLFIATLSKIKRSLSLTLAASLVFVSIITTGVITAYFDYPPTLLFSQIDFVDRAWFENLTQQKPFSHLSTWFIGLLAGYYLTKLRKIQVKCLYSWIGWMVTITCLSCLVFGVFEWNRAEKVDTVRSTLYAALYRPVWSLCLVWISFVCSNGNAGTVNSTLSWNGWIPMSRVSYFFYLIFPLFQDITFAQGRELLQVSLYLALFLFSGVFVLGGLTSLLCSLLVQQPIESIIRAFTPSVGNAGTTASNNKGNAVRSMPSYDRSMSVTSEMSVCSEISAYEIPPVSKNKRDSCVPLSLNMV